MLRLLRIMGPFSRKVEKDVDPQKMRYIQLKIFQTGYKRRYKLPQQFKHEDTLYEQALYGNKCQISGITQNNLKSVQFTRQVIGSSRPKLVILGGLNDTQSMAILHQSSNRFTNVQNLASGKLFCKSTLLPIIQKRIQNDKHYFFDTKQKNIWRTDKLNRSLIVNDYLNAAYQSMFSDYKLIYGKPSSIYIFQDLMLTLSLEELQQIFQKTLEKVKEKHQTSCDHMSSVVMQQIKTYSMYEEPRLYSKQITYTTALLNRLTKLQNRNLLLIPTCFVKRIAQQVHHIDFEPQSVYRNWISDQNSQNYGKLTEIVSNQKVSQLLQKFAILSILKGFHLQLNLHLNKNIFKNSIFNSLLGGFQPQQIIQLYRPLKSKYMQKVFQIQRQRIKNNIEFHPPQTEYMYLTDQFQTLQKRQQMFLFEYKPKNYITDIENTNKISNLKEKIQEIVDLECDQYERKLFQQYKNGNTSKQNIVLYTKLVGKANVELKDKVKLPYYHFNAFRGFYKEYYRDQLLFDQDKKQKKLQMKKLRKIQQNVDKISKQIKDPETLRKYLSGQMGPVKQLNVYEDQNGQIDIDGQIEDIQQVVAELGNDDMKKDFQQFRKANPRQKNYDFDEQDLSQDLDQSEDTK